MAIYLQCIPGYSSRTKLNEKFGAEPNVRPPGTVSPTGEKFRGGIEIPLVTSCVLNAVTLAYTARAMFMRGGPI